MDVFYQFINEKRFCVNFMDKQQVYNFLKKNDLLEEAKEIFLKYNHFITDKEHYSFEFFIDSQISKYNRNIVQLISIISALYNKSLVVKPRCSLRWKKILSFYIHKSYDKCFIL